MVCRIRQRLHKFIDVDIGCRNIRLFGRARRHIHPQRFASGRRCDVPWQRSLLSPQRCFQREEFFRSSGLADTAVQISLLRRRLRRNDSRRHLFLYAILGTAHPAVDHAGGDRSGSSPVGRRLFFTVRSRHRSRDRIPISRESDSGESSESGRSAIRAAISCPECGGRRHSELSCGRETGDNSGRLWFSLRSSADFRG